MRHLIAGVRVNLREKNETELKRLITWTKARIERAEEELESLEGELIRRQSEGKVVAFPLRRRLARR